MIKKKNLNIDVNIALKLNLIRINKIQCQYQVGKIINFFLIYEISHFELYIKVLTTLILITLLLL